MARQKYSVDVRFTQTKTVTLNNIWGEDETEAEEKAADIVSEWDGVDDVIDTEAEEM